MPGSTGSVSGGRMPGAGVMTVVVGGTDGLDVVVLVVLGVLVVVSVVSVVSVVVSVGVGRYVVLGRGFTSVRGTQVYSGLGTKPGGTTAGGGVGGGGGGA